jgi:hypothetical protein
VGDVSAAEASLRSAAIALVRNDRGVRVEDYLTALAAATGEAALAAAGFDVAGHDLAPGSPLFYEPVNTVLSGDVLEDVPAASVHGILASGAEGAPTPKELYELVAGSLGQAEWGRVTTTVDADHRPWVLPLRTAYELRPTVVEIATGHNLTVADRATLTATAARAAIEQVADAIERAVALRLVLEVTFGMAKMAPMTAAALSG